MTSVTVGERKVLVWDAPVRIFHWALVLSVAATATTGFLFPANWLSVHIWAGACVAALILFRLLWGMTGSTYSRFRFFPLTPGGLITHVRDILKGRIHRTAGHNPLGAWMVVSLLLALSALVLSGVIMLGGMHKQGPGKSFVSFATGDFLREPHEILAWLLLALIAMHISGVVFESLRSRENLVQAMITGRKRPGFSGEVGPVKARWRAALVGCVAGGALISWAGVSVSGLSPHGVPTVAPDPAWRKECGECHEAFHPTLLPAESWQQIMASLDDHFGEDASLPAEKTDAILAFLKANSAETSDSLPANRFRQVNAARPTEITATPFWTAKHGGIADAVFLAPPVRSKQNCAACHADAESGMFAPQSISIPTEKRK